MNRVSLDEQRQMGLLPQRSQHPANFVAPDRMDILPPSRHEVIDPYASAPALQQAQMVSHHRYTPKERASAMLVKTTAVTGALSVLTCAAMIMLDSWGFFAWLLLASFEWCAVFCWLALLDFRETPAAHLRQKTQGYLSLMEREQRARLKALYGYDGE